MYDKKLKEFKLRQNDILLQMEEHSRGDEAFYITANKVLDLAHRALEIFESSETEEKRTLLNYLLQNAHVNGRKLEFSLRTPFDAIAKHSSLKSLLRGQDSNL